MIVLFTDYGYAGPYVGQLHGVLHEQASAIPIVDLMHDAPTFNAKASAYLLASIISPFPKGSVFCCVVDPGVGSERLPSLVQADGHYFVGPDNGLFTIIAQRARQVTWHTITWQPDSLSNTFHGRDLFAPVAAMLAKNTMPETEKVQVKNKLREYDWPDALCEIIYCDSFGNVMTGMPAESLKDEMILQVAGRQYHYAQHFSAVEPGQAFWYRNSLGLIEIAVNTGRADLLPGLEPGAQVEVLK